MASFPHLPVTDFPGCTQNFERLLPLLNASESATGTSTRGAASGEWLATTPTANIEGSSVQARLEMGGAIVRLRGNYTVKVALKPESKIFTLSAPVRPSAGRFGVQLNASVGAAARLTIPTSGECDYYGAEVAIGTVLSVEGVTFVV